MMANMEPVDALSVAHAARLTFLRFHSSLDIDVMFRIKSIVVDAFVSTTPSAIGGIGNRVT